MKLSPKYLAMAREWARELSKFKNNELLVSEVILWGFDEVEKGRNPDVVLKEMLEKIGEALAAKPN